MMKGQLISFETAKLAKEKGLYIPESDYAYFNGILQKCGGQVYCSCERCETPTQSLLQKWLREEHHIGVWVERKQFSAIRAYKWMRNDEEDVWRESKKGYKTYEEALEIGHQKA